jgi:hypothetical protein
MTRFKLAIVAAVMMIISAYSAQAQIHSDLFVRHVAITPDASGLFVSKVHVAVSNGCLGSLADTSYALVTFKTSAAADAKTILMIGNSVKALKGGETFSQSFDVSANKIGVGRHILVQADPYNKVTEASEANNSRTMYPNKLPVLLSQYQCRPKVRLRKGEMK